MSLAPKAPHSRESLGQRPGIVELPKHQRWKRDSTSGASSIQEYRELLPGHFRRRSSTRAMSVLAKLAAWIESRFQRFASGAIEFPGALPTGCRV